MEINLQTDKEIGLHHKSVQNAGPSSETLAQHQTSTVSTPRVCWELRSAGLVLLNTAGDDYKLTPTQCLLNVGPASSVLSSIHSVQFSDSIYIYIHSTYNIQYRTKENKTIRKEPCKAKTIPDIQKKLIRTHNNHPPPYLSFFFDQSPTWTENLVHVVVGDE